MEAANYLSSWGIAAVIVATFSHILYIKAIVVRQTKPSRVTWSIWSILGIIIAVSYYLSGATATLWVPVGEAVWYIIIALLSIKYGQGGWTPVDRLALIGAMTCGLFWYFTGSVVIALTAAIGVDFMAAIPTIHKSYKASGSENRRAWVFTCISSTFNLIAINRFSFSIMIYPIYMFF